MNASDSRQRGSRTPPQAGGAITPVAVAAHEAAAERLAAGFGEHVGRWARRLGANAAAVRVVQRAAMALSLATSEGHVCLWLHALETTPEWEGDAPNAALRAALLASGVVGTPSQPGSLPLILDDEGRLYLHRHFDHERRLATRLLQAARAAPVAIDAELRQRLDTLFQTAPGTLDWQKMAAALALRGRLTLVSGGPGTGKTTTVVNLLACLIAQNPDCRIALAAPTGKAAARLTEALRQRAAQLPEALRARLPTSSSTVHRLLGVTPAAGGFVHHAGHLLAIDVLVVDEASMLDLALATRLLEAVPPAARIVLLGDKDQLASVEAGAVFAELGADPRLSAGAREALAAVCGLGADAISPAPATQPSPIEDAVVWFTQNFRFAADSGIGRLAADINANRAAAAVAWLRSGTDDSVRWLEEGGSAIGAAALHQLVDGYAAYLDAVRSDPGDAARILDAFGRFRALCAVREGPRGMRAVNERMTRHALEVLATLQTHDAAAAGGSPWFVGRPVMVLRNDPVQKLFNGDIGVALPDADGALNVVFPAADGGLRRVAPVRLPEHQTAFAMTVHKAQGSEFDAVLVLLPQRHTPVLTRELLYTAVTRARHRVALAAGADVLSAAIRSPTRRHAGLLARLRDAAASANAASPGPADT